MLVYRFEYKPKKVKTEHDKKAKKRKHEYEEDEEDEVLDSFHINLINAFSYSPGWFGVSRFILFSSLVSGRQAQKEDKRQEGIRGKEIQKRGGGKVEMVSSFWQQIVLFLMKLHTQATEK